MQKSIRKNKTMGAKYMNKTVNILLVDPAPHLLRFLAKQIDNHEAAYQILYKVAKRFENSCLKEYDGKFIDTLVEVVSDLIKDRLLTINPSELKVSGEASQSQADKSLYLNLVLINMFLQKPLTDHKMKIKNSNLRFESSTVDKIIASLDSSKVQQLSIWATETLKTYSDAFKAQKCSFRTKIEDGIPSDTYEFLGGQGQGPNNLLKPLNLVGDWIWHPLFVNIDG
jgi:hypothetical protein